MEQNINLLEKQLKLNNYQAVVMTTDKRNAALVAGVGTGKTLSGILRGFTHNEFYPGSLGLIIRKEFTDLRDSTMKDFESNFHCKVSVQSKTFTHKNGSQILFRHGDLNDLNILKNINLSWFVIEQAEEYDTAAVYDFLRDRLRRSSGPQWCLIICNVNGHNWVYLRFIENAKAQVIDERTGQYIFEKENSVCATANTFANEHNLPPAFIADLLERAKENPTHHQQYVMNDFNVIDADDLVFPHHLLESARKAEFSGMSSRRIFAADVARFGDNKAVMVILEDSGGYKWREIATESWQGKDANHTIGRIAELAHRFHALEGVVDGDGLGGPIYDVLKDLSKNIRLKEFRNIPPAADDHYANPRTQGYFELKDMMEKGWLRINSQEAINELANIRYTYNARGQKILISKETLRRKGIDSPDYADAWMMATTLFKTNPASPLKGGRTFKIVRRGGPAVDY